MDVAYIQIERDQILSRRREKLWSMNSQRLEEIVAELMKPISDVRRTFDLDLCALLEEYLTEAGLHALDAQDAHDGVTPNFAELALLLQQSANIYGKKVDFLYQHVLYVSDSLHNNTQETATDPSTSEGPHTSSTNRRKRRASAIGEFVHIELEAGAGAGARRDAEAPARPPPTLPRMYIELEPRTLFAADVLLLDYAAEPVGLLTDFQVTWRLHDGLLVDELQGAGRARTVLRPLSLAELRAALAGGTPSPRQSPITCAPDAPPAACTPPATDHPSDDLPPPPKKERRKRNNGMSTSVKIVISKELRRRLAQAHEFSAPGEWVGELVAKRKSYIQTHRRWMRAHWKRPATDFRGFASSDVQDIGGFLGWSASAAELAMSLAMSEMAARRVPAANADSDDDGFFERSSLWDADVSRFDNPPGAGDEWQSRVLQAATAAQARGGVDVRQLGARVLHALAPPPAATAFTDVLRCTARQPHEVSHLLLASLFLANAGNVEVVAGAPLSVDSFALRLVSADERLYSAAAADEPLLA